MTANRMQGINREIDEECQSRFGCRFLTGVKARSGRSVEDLQMASEKKAKELSRERELALRKKIKEMEEEEKRLEAKRIKAREEEKKIEEHYSKIAQMYNSLLEAYKLLKEKAKELKIAIDDKELSRKLHELVR